MAVEGDVSVAAAIARLSTQVEHMAEASVEARAAVSRSIDGLGQRLSNHADTIHKKIDENAKVTNAKIETVSERVLELDHCVDRRVGSIEAKLGTWRAIGKFVTATIGLAVPVLGAVWWILKHVTVQL